MFRLRNTHYCSSFVVYLPTISFGSFISYDVCQRRMFPKIVCSRNEITLKFCGTFWNHEKVVSSLNSFHSKCVANHFRAEQSLIWHFYFLNHITLNPLSILSNRANRRISIKSYLCLHLQNASKIHWFFEGNEGDSILFTIQTLLH